MRSDVAAVQYHSHSLPEERLRQPSLLLNQVRTDRGIRGNATDLFTDRRVPDGVGYIFTAERDADPPFLVGKVDSQVTNYTRGRAVLRAPYRPGQPTLPGATPAR